MRTIILTLLALFAVLTVEAQQVPDCQAPDNLFISNLTSTSVSLNWGLTSGHDAPTLYTLTLKDKSRAVIWQDNALTAPSLTHNLTGLTPNTTYIIELTGNCNASSSGFSTTSTITFTTLCGPLTAPYTQDFDTLTSLPTCTYSSAATISYVSRYGKGLALHTTVSQGAYFVFPSLTITSNMVECSLWLKASTVLEGDIPVQIGLITDPSDIGSSFEPLYSCMLTDLNWKEIQMNTTNTQQPLLSTAIIAVSVPSGYEADVYVDDVSIHEVPTCIRPEDFTVTNVLSTSATFSWTTTNASDSRIYISSAQGQTSVLASSNPFTLNNLTPNTHYTFTLRGICSPSDSSELCRDAISLTTKCDIAPSPLFHETFDTLSVPNTIPMCWESGWLAKHQDVTVETPFTSTVAQVHSGARAMMLQNQPTGTSSYLSSQLIPVDVARQYTLSVWVYRQNATQHQLQTLRFWASPSYNSTAGATLLGTVPLHYLASPAEVTANLWYNYEYVIPSAGNCYIIVEGVSETGAVMYFDDVEVKLTPSCMKVSDIHLSSPSSTDVDLIWSPGNTESHWAVTYTLTQNATIVSTVTDTVTAAVLNVSNLTPATVYSISGSIKALCSAGDTSVAVPFSQTFTTTCLPLTSLPYSCGFESSESSVMANPLPLCWQRRNNGQSSSNFYPDAVSSANLARTGSGYLRFFPSSSTLYNHGDYQMAILPEIDTSYNLNRLRLTFYARTQEAASTHNFIVGVISDPDDTTTFVAVDSFPVYGNVYRRHEILFDSYSGQGRQMVMMVRRANNGRPLICVDDMVIDLIPSCRDIAGNGVNVTDITDATARITVTDTTVTTWQYAFGMVGAPVSSLTPVNSTSANVYLSNLLPSTTYCVYARRLCGSENGNWCDAVRFTTACAAASVPYSEDFETHPLGTLHGCFVVEAGNTEDSLVVFNSPTGAAANQTFNHTDEGSRGIASSDGTVFTSVSSFMNASAYVHLEAGRNYEISLYAKKYANSAIDYSYHLTFVMGVTTSLLTPVGSHDVNSDYFQRYASTFSVPATGNYYVGFRTSPNVGSAVYYPYIDDIRIEEIACSAPVYVLVSDLSASSATLNINSTASSWQVAVSSFPIDIQSDFSADIMNDTVTSPVVSVTGLRLNADYYYTVRSICANGELSSWTTPGTFHTHCSSPAIPYNEDFERIGSTLCWSHFGGAGSAVRATDQKHSGNASMRATAVSLLSPQFNVVSFASYQLSAFVRTTGTNSIFNVGVMNDPDDLSSYEVVYSYLIPVTNKWCELTIPFDILNDPEYLQYYNARYILVTISGDSAVYIDDLNIDEPPTCPKPSNALISNVTSTTAVVDWAEPGTATTWRIRLVPANGAQTTVDVTSHPYTLTSLNPSSQYTVYVSSHCTSTDHSSELNLGQFTTSCGVVTAPYSEDFEQQTLNTTPACWDIVGNTSNGNVQRVWGVHQISGNRSIRMWNGGVQNGNAPVNSPEIYIPAGQSFELVYDYCHQATSGPLKVNIRRRGETTYTTLTSHSNGGKSTTEYNLPLAFITNTIPLTAYAGDTVRIQFLNVADDIFGEGAIFVDNVRIRVANPCSEPSVAIKSITETTAGIQISDTTHTTWQYVYGLQNFDITQAQPQNTTSNVIQLTGLASFTFYDIYVRAVCAPGSCSDWHRLTFQTTLAPTTLPYATDFSNPSDNDLWSAEGDEANSFVFGVDAAALINSTHALYVSSDGQHYDYDVTVNSMSCISRLFLFEDDVYDIEFDWQCPGGKYVLNGVADYGRFYLMPAYANTLPEGQGMYYKYYFWDDGIIPLDGDTCLELIPGYQHTSAIVDMNGRSGAYRLVFFWFTESDGGQSHYPLSVANLSLQALTCNPVANLVVPAESITQTTALVHCDNTAPLLRWAVSTSALVVDSLHSGVSTTDTFTIHGLLPSTRYHLFVRSECSSSDVSPWSEVVFHTLCGPISSFPHSEDFEDAVFPPYCWSGSGWSRYNNRPYQYAHGTGCAQAGFSTNQPLVSPELLLEASRQYYVSFWLLRSNMSYHTDQLKVYISPSTSLSDATLLQSYITYDVSASTQEMVYYKIDLPEGLAGIYHIIFAATGTGTYQTVYLDDVLFGIYPLCRELKTAPVVTAHTSTTVTMSSAMNNYTSVQYGIAPYSATATPSAIIAISDTCCITGLVPNTSYSVFARGICSFCDDTTAWSPAVKVTTRQTDCFTPDGLSFVTQTSDTMASVRWNSVPDVTVYRAILSSAAGSDTFTTTSTTLTLTPLTANTTYTFALCGICSGSDTTDFAALSFTTLRTPATIPYHTGFEPTDDNALWHIIPSAYSNFVIGTDGGGRRSGTQGLYISADGNSYSQTVPAAPGSGNVYGAAYITRTIHFDEPGNYEVSFDWKCDPISENTYGYYNAYGRAFIAPVDAMLPVDANTLSIAYPTASLPLASTLTGAQTWQHSSFVVSVAEAGYRDMVFQWYAYNKYNSADASDLSDYPLAVDNLDITRVYCLSVDSLVTHTYSDTCAVIRVHRSLPVGLEYACLTVNNADSIRSIQSIDSDTIRLEGLQPQTTYYLFVRQVCDSVYSSTWRSHTFRTTNAPAQLPYVCDFEDTDENNRWLFRQNQQNQFVIGTNVHGDGSHALYVSSDGSSNTYNTIALSYAFATRVFYLTPGDYYISYDWRDVGESNHDFARLFLYPADRTLPVGTYLPDLGPSTLPYSAIAADGGTQLAGQPSFAELETNVSIAHEGSYNLVVSWYNDAQSGSNPPFALDNLVVRPTSCHAPAVTVVNDLQSEGFSSAVITTEGSGMDILYAVSTTGSFADAVLVDTIRNFSGCDTILLASLSPSTAYYLLARSLCTADDYSLPASTSFMTPCGAISTFPYRESFESISTTYISGMITSICWTPYGATSSSTGNPRYQASTTASNVSAGSRSLQLVSHRTNALTLMLPEMSDYATLRLTFDVRYDNSKNMPTLTAGYLTDPTDASTFVTLCATTATTSFTNYVVPLNAVPSGSRIAFRYVGGNAVGKIVYLDNVAVLNIVNGESYSDTICYSDDYTAHGFLIPADSIPVGVSSHSRTVHATVTTDPDTIHTLTLLKRPQAVSTTYDTICGGHPYISGIWNIPSPTSRRYHQLFPGASVYGCDSTAELYLTVIAVSNILRDTICHGDSYQFGDQTLTTSGQYVRSYQTIRGCTATDTLFLHVVADSVFTPVTICYANLPYRWNGHDYYATGRYTTTITGPHMCRQTAVLDLTVFVADSTLNVTFCAGGTLLVLDTVIDAPGNYTLNRINQFGCDVRYHVNATETPIVPVEIYDVACQGKPYTRYGITSLIVTTDTVVTITTRSLDNRCDSIANIHLTYRPTVYADTNAVLNPDGTFTWHSQTYTVPGDYKITLHTNEGCDSVVTLHLAVGVDDVRDITLTLVPNPLSSGATAYIYGDFGELKRVEILNTLGQVVRTIEPQTYPIELTGITAAGLYHVRLTAANGGVYQQKLIVR